MKSHISKLAENINKMKTEIDKRFVRMAGELTDVRCKMADTKSDIYKFVDDKFSCEEDGGNHNRPMWVKVAAKQVEAKLGQVAFEVQKCKRHCEIQGMLPEKSKTKRPGEITYSCTECQKVMLF